MVIVVELVLRKTIALNANVKILQNNQNLNQNHVRNVNVKNLTGKEMDIVMI